MNDSISNTHSGSHRLLYLIRMKTLMKTDRFGICVNSELDKDCSTQNNLRTDHNSR